MRSRLSERQRSFIREFMAIRREVSPRELQRLPSSRDMAYRLNVSLKYFYRIASGERPKHPSAREATNYVPRGTNNRAGVSR